MTSVGDAASIAEMGGSDAFVCLTSKCNAPAADACAISTAPAYTPITCPASPPVPGVSAAPIACFSNLAGGAPGKQSAAVAGSAYCIATTVSCANAPQALSALCGSSKGAVRVYTGACAAC